MATKTRRLPDSDAAANGRRYTTEEREAAFLHWVSIARRTFAKTSEATGIAESTLRDWAKSEDWAGRADQWTVAAIESSKVSALAVVVDEVNKSLTTLVELRDGAQNERVRLDAALAILAFAGISTKPQPQAKPAEPKPIDTPYHILPDRDHPPSLARLMAIGTESFASTETDA